MPLARNTILAALAWLAACCGSPPAAIVPPAGGRHVQLLQLDGYRPDLVRALLRAGRLPNLARLVARGRIAYDATTVDKSETMKVIQSYLTSQLDTKVAGGWQFERNRFRFSNYWLDESGPHLLARQKQRERVRLKKKQEERFFPPGDSRRFEKGRCTALLPLQ